MALPASVSTCRVDLRLIQAIGVPLDNATVTFEASVPYARVASATPPTVVSLGKIVCNTDANGQLVSPDGSAGVYLVASDDPNLDPSGWTYTATISQKSIVPITVTFVAPSGGSIDLSSVVKVPASPGAELVQWQQAVADAQAARDQAAASAAAAAAVSSDASRLTTGTVDDARLPNTALSYGAVADGASHPLSAKYATLAMAQVDFPAAQALTDETDWAAIASCIAAHGGCLLPSAGTYVINKPIPLSGQWLQGTPGRATILQTANNTQVIRATGYVRVSDVTTAYTRQQTSSESSSCGIELTNVTQGSSIRRCSFKLGAYGVFNVTTGYTFSTTFEDIVVSGFSITGFDCQSSAGKITGNVLSNIYIQNNYAGPDASSTGPGMVLAGWSEGSLTQINVEHLIARAALEVTNCPSITIDSLHVEGLTLMGDFTGVVGIYGTNTRVSIAGMSVIFSTFDVANISTSFGLFKISDGIGLDVVGLQERSNTQVGTIANKGLVFNSSVTAAVCRFKNAAVSLVSPGSIGGATKLNSVAEYNGNRNYDIMANRTIISGTAAPTSFAWVVGDEVRNITPAETGTAGSKYVVNSWLCVTAGSPGIWVQSRSLTGN